MPDACCTLTRLGCDKFPQIQQMLNVVGNREEKV